MNECNVCPHHCDTQKGTICQQNPMMDENTIYASAIAVDPIEKKPLYHYKPGTKTLSIGTVGCNLHCLNCQNSSIALPEKGQYIPTTAYSPEDIIKQTLYHDLESISWTYNEPIVHYKWIINTAKLAQEHDIKTILVTNGYTSKETLNKLEKYVDAVNVDIKGMNNKFYTEVCKAQVEPVLESVKFYFEHGIHVEVTNLLIPTYNDDEKSINDLINFIKGVSSSIPVHFSRFFPQYKLNNIKPTDIRTIKQACTTAKYAGIKYVYPGNIQSSYLNNSYCKNCKHVLIKRTEMSVKSYITKNNSCPNCNHLTDIIL